MLESHTSPWFSGLSTNFFLWFERTKPTNRDSFAKCCLTNLDYHVVETVGVAMLLLTKGGLKE